MRHGTLGTCPSSEMKRSWGLDAASLPKAPSLARRVSNLCGEMERMMTNKTEQGLQSSEPRSLSGAGQN